MTSTACNLWRGSVESQFTQGRDAISTVFWEECTSFPEEHAFIRTAFWERHACSSQNVCSSRKAHLCSLPGRRIYSDCLQALARSVQLLLFAYSVCLLQVSTCKAASFNGAAVTATPPQRRCRRRPWPPQKPRHLQEP